MALEHHEASLCACGEPKTLAWHGEMDGWYRHEGFVCHGCTAQQGRQVVYGRVVNTRPADAGPLPPFQVGVTTTPPDDRDSPQAPAPPAERSIA